MTRYLDRKAFVTSLGAAGLGLGLTASGIGARGAQAQEVSTPTPPEAPEAPAAPAQMEWEAKKLEFYNEFTAALATELNVANADEVDAAIRKAIMTVIDARVTDGMFTRGQADALKTVVATAETPIGPGFFGPGPGMVIAMHHGPMGFGGPMGPGGHGEGGCWTTIKGRTSRDDEQWHDTQADKANGEDSPDEAEQEDASP